MAAEATTIEYSNATTAPTGLTLSQEGAGHLLHRDLIIVSVNDNEFMGGGTCTEHTLKINSIILHSSDIDNSTTTNTHPWKPIGVGHCIAHYLSSKRHAGAVTTY
jgi:hypothetical protein